MSRNEFAKLVAEQMHEVAKELQVRIPDRGMRFDLAFASRIARIAFEQGADWQIVQRLHHTHQTKEEAEKRYPSYVDIEMTDDVTGYRACLMLDGSIAVYRPDGIVDSMLHAQESIMHYAKQRKFSICSVVAAIAQ